MSDIFTGLLLVSLVGFVVSLKFFGKKPRIVFVVLIALFFILFGVTSDASKNTNKQITTTQIAATPTTTLKAIGYEIYKRWSIPNGGEGKVVIITPDYMNETDMPLVGEKLKNDTESDRNAFISVFTDKKAADMRDKVLGDELSSEDRDYYDSHYVGQYTKNGNSGYNEFVIYYDGVLGSNSKIVKY